MAVLGSARLAAGSDEWAASRRLGGLLGAAGATVVTGGYHGLMGAAAEGAQEAGAGSVGLPMAEWKLLQPDRANSRLTWCRSYGERLDHISRCDAVVAVWGGIGTLSEWTVAWANLQTEVLPRAIVLVGDSWREVMRVLRSTLVADELDFEAIQLVDHVAEVPAAILQGMALRGDGRPRG